MVKEEAGVSVTVRANDSRSLSGRRPNGFGAISRAWDGPVRDVRPM